MMTREQWRQIKYFTLTDNWGDPFKMDFDLVCGLVQLRKYTGRKIYIHCGYEKRLSGGFHPKGRAVDLHIESLHPMEQYIAASRFEVFTGIGVYLWWSWPGLHLDHRPLIAGQKRIVWGSLKKKQYKPINKSFLKIAMQDKFKPAKFRGDLCLNLSRLSAKY